MDIVEKLILAVIAIIILIQGAAIYHMNTKAFEELSTCAPHQHLIER